MVLRIRYEQRGGHVHCRVFTAPTIYNTFAKNGDLVFDEREWPIVRRSLRGQPPDLIVEILPEHALPEGEDA